MIPPRLRQILIHFAFSDYVIDSGKHKGKRRVSADRGKIHTANHRATDLRLLERKGLIRFERLESMSEIWGCPWFEVEITEAGREEVAEEFARRCAEADEQNAKLEVPEPPSDEVDEARAGAADRAEVRARQRAAKP
jgi:hypothetical protein